MNDKNNYIDAAACGGGCVDLLDGSQTNNTSNSIISNKLETERSKKNKVLPCRTCGTATHKIEWTLLGRKKQPLTVEGQVLRGICLNCNGPPATAACDTNEPRQRTAAAGAPHQPPIEPNASTPYVIPTATVTYAPPHPSSTPTNRGVPKILEVKMRNPDDATVVSQITMDQRLANSDSEDEDTTNFRVRPGERRPEPSLCGDDEDLRPENWRPKPLQSKTKYQQQQIRDPNAQQFAQPLPPFMEEEKAEIEPLPTNEPSPYYNNMMPNNTQTKPWPGELSNIRSSINSESDYHYNYLATKKAAANSSSHSIEEIPILLEQLHSRPRDVILMLAQIVWELGQEAKMEIANQNGIAGIIRSMWASMGDTEVQEAAVHLLFGLAASSDAQISSDVLVGESADDAVDALLIVMQQFLTVESIQHSGCGILACLGAASGDNPNVNDGSLSGALVSVISAMEAHRNSNGVQEWGLRCMYNLCVYSRHAESNKRILAKHGMEGEHQCGASIIYQAIELNEADMVTVEWACRLYWCLSASEDLAETITATHRPIHVILETLQRYHAVEGTASLLEAIFGSLANMVKVRENHKVVDSSVMQLIIASAHAHRKNPDLQIEAFALMANLIALATEYADVAVDAEAIKVIFKAIKTFPRNVELFEEATRCLSCLCITSEDAKGHLSTPAMLSYISLATTNHKESITGQEMFFFILSSILTQRSFWKTLVAHGGVDMIVTAMKNHPSDRRVQEAACLTMRNLACGDTDAAPVDFSEPINLILAAMANHPSSASIQLHGCCALWNLAFVKNQFKYNVNEMDMIRYIVKAMQNHMESASVLQMACGALCSKIGGSKEKKQCLVNSGGLDAVTCVLVMHPNETDALENACGVLSSMSASPGFADDVESAQCLSNVVEAMRSNSASTTLLEFGCMILINIILIRTEYSEEASGVAATILQAMRSSPDAVNFQREACCLLSAMAAVSETCKAKILSLDGITVLLSCLEHNGSFSDIQDAALGAFNQLSKT